MSIVHDRLFKHAHRQRRCRHLLRPPLARTWLSALMMAALGGPALAQVRPPDPGLLVPRREPAAEPPPAPPIASGSGAREGQMPLQAMEGADRAVPIDQVRVEGSTLITPEEWQERLASVTGRSLTLPQMRAVAAWVQAQVQASGRPFSVAYLPPQDLSGHTLRIKVVEGRYGHVNVQGDLANQAGPWLAPLAEGQPIGPELERQVQLLAELPGVQATATVSPGAQPGQADVAVEAAAGRRWGGELRADNHGNRYAGRGQAAATAFVNHWLALGDRLVGAIGGSQEGGLQGNVGYGVPVGTRGLRLNLSAGSSRYELGKDYTVLKASGRVRSLAASLAVPLVVSGHTRVDWRTGLQHQTIINEQALFGSRDQRETLSWTNGLQVARWLDDGGTFWGNVAAETGEVRLREAASRSFDTATAATAGGYLLLTADASLLKPVGPVALYGRLSAQLADRNLDPSRKMVLGGVGGVRAWPASEAAGDDGVLAQVELRARIGQATPFTFVDAGRVVLNHRPWAAGRQERSLTGAGLGLRWSTGPWQLQSTAGWRIGPDRRRPAADPSASSPQFWLSLSYLL